MGRMYVWKVAEVAETSKLMDRSERSFAASTKKGHLRRMEGAQMTGQFLRIDYATGGSVGGPPAG